MLPVRRGESIVGNSAMSEVHSAYPTYPKARELLEDFFVLGRKKNLKRPPLLGICFVGIGVG